MKKSPETESLLIAADQYYRGGDHQRAGNIYAQILTLDPANNEALFMTGIILFNAKKYEPAEKFLRLALKEKSPMTPMQAKTLGDLLRTQGRGAESMEMYKKAVQLKPDYVEAIGNLASLCLSENRLDEALFHCKKALALKPDYAFVLYNMGAIHELQGKFQDALSYYERALSLKPDIALALSGVGRMLQRFKKPDEAFEYFKKSVALQPTAEAYAHMGEILQEKDKYQEAIEIYKIALATKPDDKAYLNNIGACYNKLERYKETCDYYRQALALDPDSPEPNSNLANALLAFGRVDEAISHYRKSFSVRPNNPALYTNYLFSMVYSSVVTPEELAHEARKYGTVFADPLFKKREFDNEPKPDRKLRVGYLSPDFRAHSVSYFLEPLIKSHDLSNFEVFAYSNTQKEDRVTERIKAGIDHWCDITKLNDDEAAEKILSDKIDILVDTAGHTGDHRLLIFARKPAPIQVTWLGYPATTGIKAIDYRITDLYADPPGMTEHLNIEELWRMPDIFCCYRPHDNSPAVIDHPPFDDNYYITFGCFNNFSKVTDPVLEAWAKIMHRVPDARLLLEIGGLEEYRPEVEARLEQLGLPLDRIILEPRMSKNQYVLYNRIDIALDPFPCNGGTTSLDTLWMGVPFITLAGKHFVSRMGVTILTNGGLPELIADSVDEYVEKAVALAQDRGRLRNLREGLRAKIAASPLMDQSRFTRNMEAAYRAMWGKWCAAQ